eukprot:scaffold70296_cov57-Phaeocystis_antarctica.AAC.2
MTSVAKSAHCTIDTSSTAWYGSTAGYRPVARLIGPEAGQWGAALGTIWRWLDAASAKRQLAEG